MEFFFQFDPRDPYYRSTPGAVAQGSTVTLRVKLSRTRLQAVNLVILYDQGGETLTLPMNWTALQEGYDIYTAELIVGDYKGLIWYYFEAYEPQGSLCRFGENTPGNALCADVPAAYQLTVYDRALDTPHWYCQGVTYHIFVDRFYRSPASGPLGAEADYRVHTDLEETPEYLPDAAGEILNRDIYGGNLQGIIDKLDYLQSLGVTTLYLSPIFEAWSNHKYNTADYLSVDPHFGDETDLRKLCAEAAERDMHVILDGVFNHTGSDSRYFNQNGRYDTLGAYQSEQSPYRAWYTFDDSPIGYRTWWGIRTLPAVDEDQASYRDFIIESPDSVVIHWLLAGISGWRLDVADELPDDFLERFRARVAAMKPDALVIGEVWEDASNKIAYGVRRKYFTECELDGVMNYPLKEGILRFLTGSISAEEWAENMESLLDHYPAPVRRCLMNLLGTHDTMRALNALSCPELAEESKAFKACYRLSEEQRARGRKLLKMASCLQYLFPGSPSIYYGDEIAMEGFEDPFNRRFYPWGRQDLDMLEHYRALGQCKRNCSAMHEGEFSIVFAQGGALGLLREDAVFQVLCAVNRDGSPVAFPLPDPGTWRELFTKKIIRASEDGAEILLEPLSYSILIREKT